MPWYRRPLLAGQGRRCLTVGLGYELVALYTDLPTISEMVRKEPLLGVVLLVGLAHHFWLEAS